MALSPPTSTMSPPLISAASQNELTLDRARSFKLTRILSDGPLSLFLPACQRDSSPSLSSLGAPRLPDPQTRTLFLLGTLKSQISDDEGDEVAIVKVEKTAFDTQGSAGGQTAGVEAVLARLDRLTSLGGNDIVRRIHYFSLLNVGRSDRARSSAQYFWANAWLDQARQSADLKLMVICPATEVHIRKVRFLCSRPSLPDAGRG